MEDKDLLELLKKLNSLDINELDEEIAKMQITYEQWSKLMGDKGYWSAGFSDILLEDKEALEGKRNISFEDFKRLAKEYGEKRVETRTTSDSSDKELKSQSQLLQEKLDPKKNNYDYIIIDCPPSLGLITLNAFTASDSVLIPVQCEYYALEGLGQLMNTIDLVKRHLNKSLEIEGALLTMFDIRTNLSNQVVKEVKRYFENKVYKTVIPRNVKLSEAPSYGMPITVYDPRSKVAKSYEKFVKELMKANENDSKGKQAK